MNFVEFKKNIHSFSQFLFAKYIAIAVKIAHKTTRIKCIGSVIGSVIKSNGIPTKILIVFFIYYF